MSSIFTVISESVATGSDRGQGPWRALGARLLVLFAALSCLAPAGPAAAAEAFVILVGVKGQNSAANAKAQADRKTTFATTRPNRALAQAAKLLKTCGGCTVTVKIAGASPGEPGHGGPFIMPATSAPRATLRILGGYDATFARRDPFGTPSVIAMGKPRASQMFDFEGRKSALKELVLSGFVMDASPGNSYDRRSNSLTKGSSSSYPLISFGYLITRKLVISDNVFMNAANSVGNPAVNAPGPDSEVHVLNNIFLNNVRTWQVTPGGYKHPLKRYVVRGNTFLLNWPYNPESTTSNPGTLEIGNNYVANLVEIEGNIFAHNVGGAIAPQWAGDRGPRIAIRGNLFWQNGALFDPAGPADGAIVGKFYRSPKNEIFDAESIEDEFSWEAGNNLVIDPKLVVPILELTAIGQQEPEAEQTPEDALDSASEDELSDPYLSQDDYAEEGGVIKNYAPRLPYAAMALPWPQEARATAYGASPARVTQYR